MNMEFQVTVRAPEFEDEDGDYQNSIIAECARQLGKKIKEEARDEVVRSVRAEIDKHIEAIVRDTLEQGIALTNTYGEATGKKTTLRELVVAQVGDWLKASVNSRGEPVYTGSRDSVTRVQWMIGGSVDSVIKGEFKKEVDAAIVEFRARLMSGARDLFAQGIQKLLGVNV
jgi:hypothetical protein